uniref:C2H2-type domain-containing protein n=1 Tax=Hyaloperonospora arabidopsidis (strain Emoy2) TaxID=559515 RepID=M4B1A1_HYAAE
MEVGRRPSCARTDDIASIPHATDASTASIHPTDSPVFTHAPLSCRTLRHLRKKHTRLHPSGTLSKRDRRKASVSKSMKRLRRLQRFRSFTGLPVTSFWDKAQHLRDSVDENTLVQQNQRCLCRCLSCQHERRWSSTLPTYQCSNKNCRITFAGFIELFEHQLDVHGGIDPKTSRIVSELYHQQQGVLACPPATVYAGQQVLFPSCPPVRWKSMDDLDEEARTLPQRLRDSNPNLFVRPFNVFMIAYELVKRNGWKEMERQYHIAMEHYFSAMKYPMSTRWCRDGCPSIERGRNWLTSTDREDARWLFPFSLGDKVDVEPEFVLMDTQEDQELYIELSDDEDTRDACA